MVKGVFIVEEFCYARAFFVGAPKDIIAAAMAYTCLVSAGLRTAGQCPLGCDNGYPAWDIFKDTPEVRALETSQPVFVEVFRFTSNGFSLDLRCKGNIGDVYLQKVCTSCNLDCRCIYSDTIKDYSCAAIGQSGLELA